MRAITNKKRASLLLSILATAVVSVGAPGLSAADSRVTPVSTIQSTKGETPPPAASSSFIPGIRW